MSTFVDKFKILQRSHPGKLRFSPQKNASTDQNDRFVSLTLRVKSELIFVTILSDFAPFITKNGNLILSSNMKVIRSDDRLLGTPII